MSRPLARDVSFRKVIFHDLISFIVGIMFLFTIVCLFSLIVLVGWFGEPPPKESPGEIIFGYLIITGVVFAILRYRVSCITETLNSGEVVVAEVVRGLAQQFFAQIFVKYTVRGAVVEKNLWFPNTKQPRAMTKKEQVSLSVPMEGRGRVVVRDLYTQENID